MGENPVDVYWTTVMDKLGSQMATAIENVDALAVDNVLRLQNTMCMPRRNTHNNKIDWGKYVTAAVKTGHTELVRALLATKPTVNMCDDLGRRPLHYAAEIGSADIMKQILNAGSPVNAFDDDGSTPLHFACGMDNSNATLLLLSEGANVNRMNKLGENPLHVACRKGKSEIAKFLLARGALVDSKTSAGLTPLHLAAKAKQQDVVRVLIALGSQIDEPDNQGRPALNHAAELGALTMVQYLLQRSAKVSKTDTTDQTILHVLACKNPPTKQQAEVMMFLLSNMSPEEVSLQDLNGSTALHHAALYGNMNMVRMLIAAAADLNLQDSSGNTPLNISIGSKQVKIAKFIISSGADVNIVDNGLSSPLHKVHSIRGEEKVDLVELLIKKGAKLNGVSEQGYTPLDCCIFHYVIGNFNQKILKLLVQHGTKLKPIQVEGNQRQRNSPLCALTWHNQICSARFLLSVGWDLRNENWLGLPGKTKAANDFIEILRKQTQEVPSLWNQCRSNIRALLLHTSDDTDITPLIHKLPVPPTTKKHILFQVEMTVFDEEFANQ